MQRQGYVFAIPRVLFAFLVLAAALLVTLRVQAQAQEHPRPAGDVCRGFVEITPQEKRELVDLLLSLSSTSTSAWTQKPVAPWRMPAP
jgi:hypothetical protein